MDAKKEARKYLDKYFKAQYINDCDNEFKSLVRLLNKVQKSAKNNRVITGIRDERCNCCKTSSVITEGFCNVCGAQQNV